MSAPLLELYVGDIHTDGPSGLTTAPQDERQAWLYETWQKKFIPEVRKRARGHRLIVRFGGDMVHKPGKRARDRAVELLQPLANIADEMWGVVGTPYHVGQDGEEDRTIYQELGVSPRNVGQFRRAHTGGKMLWWLHHGARLGADAWTEFDGLTRTAKRAQAWADSNGKSFPHIVILHHAHRYIGVARYVGHHAGRRVMTRAVVCPCWELPDDYHARRVIWSTPTIGALAWKPETQDEPEVIEYAIPDDLFSG